MILGRASNVYTYSDPDINQRVENYNKEREIYLFFDIEDVTGGKTHIACCEEYEPNHRFLHFR
mgnify:CR=1 FL=1